VGQPAVEYRAAARAECLVAAYQSDQVVAENQVAKVVQSSHHPMQRFCRHDGKYQGIALAKSPSGGIHMLYTLAVILLIAWLLGIVGTYTIGAFVHVLLVVAIVLFLVGLISGRETIA
jgi:hypothetical protein